MLFETTFPVWNNWCCVKLNSFETDRRHRSWFLRYFYYGLILILADAVVALYCTLICFKCLCVSGLQYAAVPYIRLSAPGRLHHHTVLLFHWFYYIYYYYQTRKSTKSTSEIERERERERKREKERQGERERNGAKSEIKSILTLLV